MERRKTPKSRAFSTPYLARPHLRRARGGQKLLLMPGRRRPLPVPDPAASTEMALAAASSVRVWPPIGTQIPRLGQPNVSRRPPDRAGILSKQLVLRDIFTNLTPAGSSGTKRRPRVERAAARSSPSLTPAESIGADCGFPGFGGLRKEKCAKFFPRIFLFKAMGVRDARRPSRAGSRDPGWS